MSYISTYPKKNSNILRLIFEKDISKIDPEYQQMEKYGRLKSVNY